MTKNNKKGFTIIEVVLVLAIAGLIFLMVFIALPALQRSQRNTRRRQDMARILSAVNDYQVNHNGQSPIKYNGAWHGEGNAGTTTISASDIDTSFVQKYVDSSCNLGTYADDMPGNTSQSRAYRYNCTGDQFKDPDGSNYSMIYGSGQPLNYIEAGSNGSWVPSDKMQEAHAIYLASGAKCSGNESKPVVSDENSGSNNIAIVYVLEGGAIYCGDNQ